MLMKYRVIKRKQRWMIDHREWTDVKSVKEDLNKLEAEGYECKLLVEVSSVSLPDEKAYQEVDAEGLERALVEMHERHQKTWNKE